jgi:hypothetical protein
MGKNALLPAWASNISKDDNGTAARLNRVQNDNKLIHYQGGEIRIKEIKY